MAFLSIYDDCVGRGSIVMMWDIWPECSCGNDIGGANDRVSPGLSVASPRQAGNQGACCLHYRSQSHTVPTGFMDANFASVWQRNFDR